MLARVDEGAVSALGENDIFFTFPAVVNGMSKTCLVLKKPKTEPHILDEDRKVNAQRFESGFYARADLRGLEQSFHSQAVQHPGTDLAQLLVQLQKNPALLALLNGLLKMKVSE